MASAKQRAAARRNIKKATAAAKRKRTIAIFPNPRGQRWASRGPRLRGRNARPSG